jgi:AcrR family transcriptional regulator
VAQGTFYNHFESRQDILDQLLPALGREMMRYIAKHSKKGKPSLEREEAAFKGFFSFLKNNPHFFRILNEAESFAPNAYRAHMEHVMAGYQKFLIGARAKQETQSFDERELQVVVLVLMAARSYIAWRFVKEDGKTENIPDWVVKAYRKLITGGVFSS